MRPVVKLYARKVPAQRRDLIVEIRPAGAEGGPTLTLREFRRQHGYTITLAALYGVLAWRAADNARATKRAARARRRA